MTTDSASHRPRLVCLCGSLVVSLAFLMAVSLFPGGDSIETVPEVEVHLRGSISPHYPSGDGDWANSETVSDDALTVWGMHDTGHNFRQLGAPDITWDPREWEHPNTRGSSGWAAGMYHA
jgi:hypothetical protein